MRISDWSSDVCSSDLPAAQELALAAYLDGFEPLEPMLTARDATLMRRIESGMGELRAALQRGQCADQVASRVQVLDGLFDDAEVALSPDARSEEHTSELQSLMRISYDGFCLNKKTARPRTDHAT